MQKQTLYLGGAALAVTLMTAIGAGAVMADSPDTGSVSKMAQAIADKFHLSPTEVQGVITDQRSQMQADRQAEVKTKLDQAVKDGKLTQTQEDALLQKMAEHHQDGQTMRQDRQDMKQWLEDNNIDLKSILGDMRMGHHRGM